MAIPTEPSGQPTETGRPRRRSWVAFVLGVVLGAGTVGGFVFVRSVTEEPAAPIYPADQAVMEAAAFQRCVGDDLGYDETTEGLACQYAFNFGAKSAWDPEDERWTSSEERDVAFEEWTRYALGDQGGTVKLPADLVRSSAFKVGFYEGTRWMEEAAPRA